MDGISATPRCLASQVGEIREEVKLPDLPDLRVKANDMINTSELQSRCAGCSLVLSVPHREGPQWRGTLRTYPRCRLPDRLALVNRC